MPCRGLLCTMFYSTMSSSGTWIQPNPGNLFPWCEKGIIQRLLQFVLIYQNFVVGEIILSATGLALAIPIPRSLTIDSCNSIPPPLAFFLPSLVGLSMVLDLIQLWAEEMPSIWVSTDCSSSFTFCFPLRIILRVKCPSPLSLFPKLYGLTLNSGQVTDDWWWATHWLEATWA